MFTHVRSSIYLIEMFKDMFLMYSGRLEENYSRRKQSVKKVFAKL